MGTDGGDGISLEPDPEDDKVEGDHEHGRASKPVDDTDGGDILDYDELAQNVDKCGRLIGEREGAKVVVPVEYNSPAWLKPHVRLYPV